MGTSLRSTFGCLLGLLGVFWLIGAPGSQAQSLRLILPTDNDALMWDDGPSFYQYTDRYFKGRRSQPWEGGQYGFVRNQKETPYGVVYTRFHEGADIKPVRRDAREEPLDEVRAIDEGQVVYTNRIEKQSSYGLYVVVEHWWSGAPFYSLYAHLNEVDVRPGQKVKQGDTLGRLGYTGRGINRRRAHVHFEVNLLLNRAFQSWYDEHVKDGDPNYHGIYNGINMAGLDVPGLYLALRDDPMLTIEDILAAHEPFFTVAFPYEGVPDLLWRYPWLSPQRNPWMALYGVSEPVAGWEITFAQSGLPLRIDPLDEELAGPVVTVLDPSPVSYEYLTSGKLTGSGSDAELTEQGLRYLDMLTREFPMPMRRVEW